MKELLSIAVVSLAVYFVPSNQAIAICSNTLNQSEFQDFRIVQTPVPLRSMQLTKTTSNQSNTFRVAIACIPLPGTGISEQCQNRIFVERRKTGQVFELKSECFLRWRPISNLRWNTDNILAFEQRANPHFVKRYTVNVVNGKLLPVSLLTDESNSVN